MTTDLKALAEDITQSLCGHPQGRPNMAGTVVNTKTNKVVGYVPGDRMLDLIKQMRDLEGILVKATA